MDSKVTNRILVTVVAIVALLVLLCLFVAPANAADYLEPPESKTVEDVKVFRNLAEDGDMLFVFQYDIAYASDNYPVIPASDSWVFRLYVTDTVTVLTSSKPYVYSFFDSNGYGPGVGSFYFAASDNAPGWGDAVQVEICGWPAFYSSNQTWRRTVTTDKYYDESEEQADNQLELYYYVLLLSDRLEGLYADVDIILKTSSDTGIVLSSYGELYFRGAIPGLQSLCPNLFFMQVYVPAQMAVEDYDMSLQEQYTERLTGTDLGNGFNRIGDLIGISGDFAAALICLAVMIAVCIIFIRKGWGIEIAIAADTIIGIFFALVVGSVLFTVLMIASLVAVIGIVYLVLLKRA